MVDPVIVQSFDADPHSFHSFPQAGIPARSSMLRMPTAYAFCRGQLHTYMGVSKNSGTQKWMVYNGKPY